MSDDKLRRGLTMVPEFGAGEAPSPQKLNAAFQHVDTAMGRVERAIGDINSDDSTARGLSNRELLSPTVGRFLGPSVGPQVPASFQENFGWNYTLEKGRNSWALPIWPYYWDSGGGSNARELTFATSGVTDYHGNVLFQTEKTSLALMTGTGDWYYDFARNTVYSYSVLASGNASAIGSSYQGFECNETSLIPLFMDGQYDQHLNVIPPLDAAAKTSITVATHATYDYVITVNPDAYHLYSPKGAGGTQLSSATLNTIGTSLSSDYGGSVFVNVTSNVNQKLPAYLSALSSDDPIPARYLTLWDHDNSALFYNADYYYKDQTSFFANNLTLDLSGTYSVVTPGGGVNVAEAVEQLRFSLKYHKHRGPYAIDHGDILNSIYAAGTFATSVATSSASYWRKGMVPSQLPGHPHPQYLHRYGYQTGIDPENFDNIMMGDIWFGNQATSDAILENPTESLGTATNYNSYGLNWAGLYDARNHTAAAGNIYHHFQQSLGYLAADFHRTDLVFADLAPGVFRGSIFGDPTELSVSTSTNIWFHVSHQGAATSTCWFRNSQDLVAWAHGSGHFIFTGLSSSFVHVYSTIGVTVDTALVSTGGYYGLHTTWKEDADVRYSTRPLLPGKSYFIDKVNKTGVAAPGFKAVEFVSTLANVGNASSDTSLFWYLDMVGDENLESISFNLSYDAADIVFWAINNWGASTAVHTQAVTTGVEGSAFSLTTAHFGTNFGVYGSRYEFVATAIALAVEITPTSNVGLTSYPTSYIANRRRL